MGISYEDILKALKDIKRDEKYRRCGICDLFRLNLRELEEYNQKEYARISGYISYLFYQWPKFSGDDEYPVPGGSVMYHNTGDLWKGDYGKLRMELLDFLIEEVEKEIKK